LYAVCFDRPITIDERCRVDELIESEARALFAPLKTALWIETSMPLDSLLRAIAATLPPPLKFFGMESTGGAVLTCRMSDTEMEAHWPQGCREILPTPPG